MKNLSSLKSIVPEEISYTTNLPLDKQFPLLVCLLFDFLIFHQMMASRFSWMHPILERQGKDGKDAVWRTIGEGTAPETVNLADSLGYK